MSSNKENNPPPENNAPVAGQTIFAIDHNAVTAMLSSLKKGVTISINDKWRLQISIDQQPDTPE